MSEAKFNQDELVPPSILTEAYILDVLRKVEEDPQLHLINYEIVPGSSAGDHYASVMFKIIVSYGSKGKIVTERRFILKTVPEAEGDKKNFLEMMPVFINEIRMYSTILPAMEKILKQHNESIWWPNLVFHQEKPFVMIFDDLTVDKYEVVYDQQDLPHLKMIIEKIAKYHALSKVLVENGMSEITTFKMEFTDEMKAIMMPVSRVLAQLVKVAKTWPGYEKIGAKVEDFIPKLFDFAHKAMTRDYSHEFNVLNHGDFHLRNLMFKRNADGELSEVIFLDFQMPNYNIPSFDLTGLLNTMGTFDVRSNEEEVFKLYHENLVANLKRYGYKGDLPTLLDILVAMLRSSDNHVIYSLIAGTMFALKGVELGDFFAAKENTELTEALRKLFNEPTFVKNTKFTLDKFGKLGVFDV